MKRCEHCKKERPLKTRGLCQSCYTNSNIRRLYPPVHEEPTEEEVERIVTEQYQNLPPWWEEESNVIDDEV